MKKRGPNKCSNCGEPGHNAKTCSLVATRASAPADPQYKGTARVRVLKPGVSGDDLALEKGIDPVAVRREPPRKLTLKPKPVARALQPARPPSISMGRSIVIDQPTRIVMRAGADGVEVIVEGAREVRVIQS